MRTVCYTLGYIDSVCTGSLLFLEVTALPRHMLAFVLDNNREIQSRFLGGYYDFQAKNPYAAEYMGSESFADERKFKRLQVADLFVYEARKLLFNKTYDRDRKTRIAAIRMAANVQALYRFDRQALELIIDETLAGVPVRSL